MGMVSLSTESGCRGKKWKPGVRGPKCSLCPPSLITRSGQTSPAPVDWKGDSQAELG